MVLTIYQLKSKRKNSAVKLRKRSKLEKKYVKTIQENVNNIGQKNEREKIHKMSMQNKT